MELLRVTNFQKAYDHNFKVIDDKYVKYTYKCKDEVGNEIKVSTEFLLGTIGIHRYGERYNCGIMFDNTPQDNFFTSFRTKVDSEDKIVYKMELTKAATKEMTMEEIEAKLGHKVKIVSKE